MKAEVQCACDFFSRLLKSRELPIQFIKLFRRRLEEILLDRFEDHWDPENPQRGSAYRCIRNNNRFDPVVREAAKATGLSDMTPYLPAEFTMWIDPNDVSYRIGEDGSICQLDIPGSSPSWESSPVATAKVPTTVPSPRSHSPPRHSYQVTSGRFAVHGDYRRSPSPPSVTSWSSPPSPPRVRNVYEYLPRYDLGGIPVQVRV